MASSTLIKRVFIGSNFQRTFRHLTTLHPINPINKARPLIYIMFLDRLIFFSVLLSLIFWHSIVIGHGGIAQGRGFWLPTYLFLVTITSVLFIIAFSIRKKRVFENWLMIVLIAPILLLGATSLFFSVRYFIVAGISDATSKLAIIGAVGVVQIVMVQQLYLSCRRHHAIET